jgi:hypothetical protein
MTLSDSIGRPEKVQEPGSVFVVSSIGAAAAREGFRTVTLSGIAEPQGHLLVRVLVMVMVIRTRFRCTGV